MRFSREREKAFALQDGTPQDRRFKRGMAPWRLASGADPCDEQGAGALWPCGPTCGAPQGHRVALRRIRCQGTVPAAMGYNKLRFEQVKAWPTTQSCSRPARPSRRYKYRSLAGLSMTESCYGVNDYLPETLRGT